MIAIGKLIDDGFEIKAATTYEVKGIFQKSLHQSIILQRGKDVFVCVLKLSGGVFRQIGCTQLGDPDTPSHDQ